MDEFPRSLDPKNRITLPSEWRMALHLETGSFVYLMPDPLKECIRLVPRDIVEAEMAREADGGMFGDLEDEDADETDAAREFISQNMQIAILDVQGRIRINPRLLASASIAESTAGAITEVVLHGCREFGRIWAKDKAPKPQEFDRSAFRAAAARFSKRRGGAA
ncbi:MAG: hypothetical protein IJ802_00970 [Kiritimatiellae bacterium]|nr:hypothetical protein [Kiritimatiellia bacterium]